MKYRKLGDSSLEVSEISLGSWLTYGVGVEAEKARACLDAAFDVGINLIDTANVYGRGAAETFLGEALKRLALQAQHAVPAREVRQLEHGVGDVLRIASAAMRFSARR